MFYDCTQQMLEMVFIINSMSFESLIVIFIIVFVFLFYFIIFVHTQKNERKKKYFKIMT